MFLSPHVSEMQALLVLSVNITIHSFWAKMLKGDKVTRT
uniref:Uncharacterized protein n=1 Tax=Anguilla anguilla TaxID=7936 RepID=A0A0E9PZ69_ANGAN